VNFLKASSRSRILTIVALSAEKCPAITRALAKRRFFRKRWRAGPKEIRGLPGHSSSPQERLPYLNRLSQFFTVDSKIALSWSVFTSSLWMSLLPCLLRKKYFTITLCSIRSIQIFRTYLNGCVKIRSRTVLSARRYGQMFSLNAYNWFRNWFSFEDIIRLLTHSQFWER
jgi:hypothetical protein